MRVFVTGLFMVLAASLLSGANAPPGAADRVAEQKPNEPTAYLVRDLGTLGGASTDAYGLNDRGDVVGWSETTAGERHAFVWRNGVMTDLQAAGETGMALGINNNDDIVGRADEHAALWRNGVHIDLGPPPYAWFINDRGDVVGGAPGSRGWFLWRDGERTDLGDFTAFGMNSRGHIAGLGCGTQHACLWHDGVATDLGVLRPDDIMSIPRGLNGSDQVVGGSRGALPFHACLWQRGAIVDLGTLGGGFSLAVAINDRAQVVGYSETAEGETHAFLWSDGVMSDLGTLGGSYSRAFAINDRGDVVGTSGDASDASYVFLWRGGVMKKLWLFSTEPGQGNTRNFHINARGEVASGCLGEDGKIHGCIYQLVPPAPRQP